MTSHRVARLAVLATVFAGLASAVASATASAASPARAVVTRTLSGPGTYRVLIGVSSGSVHASRVRLSINSGSLRTVSASRKHHASVSVSVTVKSRKLVVRAVDSATAKVNLKVATQPLKTTGPSSAGTTSGASGGSSGTDSTATSGVGSGSGQPGPPGDPSSWHSIFDDEFNGTSLNTADWSTGWYGSGMTGPISTTDELQCYDPSHVVEANGELDENLTATPETCPTGSGPISEQYDSGMITTNGKFDYTYGYMEARVWMPGTSGITDWPAVWAQGQAGNWPVNGELDVVEGLGGAACWHFHDPSGGPGGCANGNYAAGWHTFGADWEPGIVTWYYDGIDVGSVTSGVTSSPMYLLVNLAVDHTYGGAIQAPATMRTDYIRIWQH
jgi:beta-glucanase (GH16 family)